MRKKGYIFTKVHKQNLSLARLGKIPWNKGLTKDTNEIVKLIGIKHMGANNTWYGKSRKGPLSPMWRGGLTPLFRRLRNNKTYELWRTQVFCRDDYTCRECGKRGVYLEAHHIKSFRYYPQLRYDTSNGLTLCDSCHKKTDNYKGRARNETDKQLSK